MSIGRNNQVNVIKQLGRSPLSMREFIAKLAGERLAIALPHHERRVEPRYAVCALISLRSLDDELQTIADPMVGVAKDLSVHGACILHRGVLQSRVLYVRFFTP